MISELTYGVAGFILLTGLWGIVTSRDSIHLVLCLSVAQSGTYVLLLAVGYRAGGTVPIFQGVPVGTPAVDPVAQALALTDIVVAAVVLALLLALAVQAHKRFGTRDPDELRALRG